MMAFLHKLFSSGNFMPHGHCYLWNPGILWLHILSDALITLAYFSIPFTLVYFVRKRKDLEFHWMFLCFAVFIVACGATHLMEIWVIWHPSYWLSGTVKAVTALASVPTAILLVRLVPDALRLPGPSTLREANEELAREVAERKRAEEGMRRLNDELEQRVAERTQELQRTNRNLAQEIRERTRIEAALRESETRLRAVLDSTVSAVVVISAEGLILDWNSRAETLFGWKRNEMLGKELADTIIPLRYREGHRRGLAHFRASGEAPVLNRILELSAIRRDGTEFPVELSISALKSGRTTTFCGFITDLTERKRMEEARDRLAAIVQSSRDAIIGRTLDSTISDWNPGAETLLGYPASGVIGKRVSMLFPPELEHEESEMVARIARGEPFGDFETVRVGKDGRRIDVSIAASPIKNSRGELIGVSTILRDITRQKRAEHALRENEQLLQAIIDNATAVIYVKDLEGRYLLVNSRFTELFHLSKAEAIGKTDYHVFPKEQADAFRAMDQRVVAAGCALTEEETASHDDGQHTYVSVKCPLTDNAGKTYAIFGISTDITERAETEQELQVQLARLDLLSRTTRAIAERQDLASIFQIVVRSLEDHFPVDFACLCLCDQTHESLTITSLGSKGRQLAAELAAGEQATVKIDANGLSRCVQGQLVLEPDISLVEFPFAQQLARAGLRSLVLAPLLVESNVFGVLIAARRAVEGFASADCEFLQQLSEHVALAAHQAQLYQALQAAYEGLRQTQQTAMQQERLRALGQMASGVAHDINNALSPVALYTEALLEKEPNLSERARNYLKTIQRAIEDVSQTVGRMREFYRKREVLSPAAPVQLNEMIEQVVELTRARWSDIAQQRGVVIQTFKELATELPPVLGVESEIREALINLIFNAVDAMPAGGALTLRTKLEKGSPHEDARLKVEVTDTGIGMDEETKRRCLEPFFTTKGERGTGMGLAMVYGMVQRHGGEIEIESLPGRGTTVRLGFLPSPIEPVSSGATHPPPTLVSRSRILVVDDDPVLLKSLADTLESDGHAVFTADGGEAGIRAFQAALDRGEPFGVVITDLGMPYVDGRKVAAAVKERSASTPVIMLTGWGQRLVAKGESPPHVDQLLSKPIKMVQLRQALGICCQRTANHELQNASEGKSYV